MEKWKRRSIDLLTSLIFGGREDMSVIPYYPQKIRISEREEGYFRRTLPEKKGISSKRIYNLLCELESERRANVHSIKILCGGEVICECHSPGYEGDLWHAAHSMSKTVCGMVIGCLWDEGRIALDMRLADLFPEISYKDKRFPEITVEHLLSMTSGVEFAEVGVVTEQSWTEAFFSSTVRSTPGERFSYNSINTYILARIAERITGRTFGSLAEELIFAPLGIKNYMWEIGPEGTEKAGWGLYLSSESWAKLGMMILSEGIFEGKRILSEEWVSRSTTVKAITPKEKGSFNYAYQMWVGRNSEEILFSGMLGQNVWICPKNDIIVVLSGGNNELFQASPTLEIVREHLGGKIADKTNFRDAVSLLKKQTAFFEHRRWARPLESGRGLLCWLGIRQKTPFDREWNDVLGEYRFATPGVGILPLIVRAMQNNLRSSLEGIALVREGEGLFLCFAESDESYGIPIGLYGYEESVIDVRGEKYIVRSLGEAYDGPLGKEYRIELVLPETASVRRIVIKKGEEGRAYFEMKETPNDRLAADYLKEYSKNNSAVAFTIDLLERRLGKGVVAKTLSKTFNPILLGVETSSPGYKDILSSERSRYSAEQKRVRFIRAVVDRFFKENE